VLKLTRTDDRGLTLIEVLMAVVLLGVIITAMAGAMITFSRNNDATTRRLSESHDIQVAAAYFAQDVEALGVHNWGATDFPLKSSIEQNQAANLGTYQCGTEAAFLRLAWDNPTSATGVLNEMRVAYVVRTVGTDNQLVRTNCTGVSGQPSNWTKIDSVVLVHNLVSVDSVACGNPTTCTSAPNVPQTVTLTMTIRSGTPCSGSLQPPACSTGIQVTLSGQRRQT
jgi:prepilin-type N-terminal cleavage/methylation domain-containing protein